MGISMGISIGSFYSLARIWSPCRPRARCCQLVATEGFEARCCDQGQAQSLNWILVCDVFLRIKPKNSQKILLKGHFYFFFRLSHFPC